MTPDTSLQHPGPAPDDAAVALYLAGEGSVEERAAVEAWMRQDAAAAAAMEALRIRLRETWPGLVVSHPAVVEERFRERLGVVTRGGGAGRARRLPFDARTETVTSRVPRSLRRPRNPRALAWVAAVAAAIAGIWVFSPVTPRGDGERRYTTGAEQQAILTLGDGTRVTLAPRSELRVAAGFGGHTRAVALEGEAYFDVTRASGAPFTVHTGAVTTRVLGTGFLVRHYATDPHVHVSVSSGKVAVSTRILRGPSMTLTAGRVGEATDSTVSSTAATGNDQSRTTWRGGRLVFDEAPATEVLATLSRWYGYEFRVPDTTLVQQRLTAALSAQSSRDALSTLKALLDVDLRFNGNVVTLVARRDDGGPAPARREVQRELTPQQREAGR